MTRVRLQDLESGFWGRLYWTKQIVGRIYPTIKAALSAAWYCWRFFAAAATAAGSFTAATKTMTRATSTKPEIIKVSTPIRSTSRDLALVLYY